MEKVFQEKTAIALFLVIFALTSIFDDSAFADETPIVFNISEITIDARGNKGAINSILTIEAYHEQSTNYIDEKDTGTGRLRARDTKQLAEGTKVIMKIENDDLGGKALYATDAELIITLKNALNTKIQGEEIKDYLNIDSFLMKDLLQEDGKTFLIEFEMDEKFRKLGVVEYPDQPIMYPQISIIIEFPFHYRGEIKTEIVIEENDEYEKIEDEIDFSFIGDGYESNQDKSRHLVEGNENVEVKANFPEQYIFDRWKFKDFEDSNLSSPFGIADTSVLKTNPIKIKPKFDNLKNQKYNINLQAILKLAPIVTFDPNTEGLNSMNIQTNSGKVILPNSSDFIREGYIISSWNIQPDRTGDSLTSGQEIEEDITVYAQWTVNENAIFITPDLNYDGKVLLDIIAKEDGIIKLPLDPKREKYKFLGWYTEKEGGERVTNSTIFTESTNIYAHWEAIDYITLKFLVNDKEHTILTIDKELKIGDKFPEIKTPIDGYFFRGWFTEEDGKGTKLSSETNFFNESGNEKNIYAYLLKKEQAGVVYVSFSYKKGTGTGGYQKSSNNITGDVEWFEPEPLQGMIFKGWYTAEKGGEKVEKGTIFLKNTELYAQWTKEKITIYFDLNGEESGSIPSVQADADGKITLSTEEPKRSGYKFIGWFDSKKNGNRITEDTIFEDDTTIYAQWEKISEQELDIKDILLKKDDKIIARGKIEGTDITLVVNLSSEQLINGDYTLAIHSSEGTEIKQEDGSKGDWSNGYINMIGIDSPTKFIVYGENDEDGETKEYILTIKRDIKELETYTVTFNTNGGSTISPVQVKDGDKVSKPSNPTKPGYKFDGWYRDVLFRYEYDFNTAITDHRELFAKWKEVEEPIDPKEPTNELPRIIRFSLLGYEASIDDRNERITINIPYNMDLGSLVPSITITEGATISPSKDSAVNFNRTVYYTVYGSGNTQKTYRVIINIPSERDSYYWDDYYDNYKKERDDYYKRRGEISWWELAKEAKEKRAEEELKIKSERDEKLVLKERAKILNDVGRIESRARNSRSSLMINGRFNYIEIRPTVSDFKSGFSNIITIPKDVLPNLLKGEYEFIKYHTGVVNIEIYPSMETASGLKLNLCDVPKDIRDKWNKMKGKGYIFQVESDSTKGGLSYELNLEKQYPVEKLRFVKYNYMKGNFEDVAPEKWYVFNGKLRCDKVSAGIYGIIYKD